MIPDYTYDRALAEAIRDFQVAHPELVPGTINSTYGLAAYLRARGYVKEFRFADPDRLRMVWWEGIVPFTHTDARGSTTLHDPDRRVRVRVGGRVSGRTALMMAAVLGGFR